MTKITLIRHGETDWNLQKRYISFTDMALNKKGSEQALLVGKRLAGEMFDKVYSSPSARALDFAKMALARFPVEIVPDLREMGFGIFEGLAYAELMQRHAQIYTAWLSDPFNSAIPQGEDPNRFRKRVMEVFGKIASFNKNGSVAAVTHAGPIRMLLSAVSGIRDFWQIPADPAGISIVEFESNGRAKVLSMNDTSHLANG